MEITWKDYHYLDVVDLLSHAVAFDTYAANGPVWECVYTVTEESLWTAGWDLMASGHIDTLDFYGFRHILGGITDIPYTFVGTYMVTENADGIALAVSKDEEPND